MNHSPRSPRKWSPSVVVALLIMAVALVAGNAAWAGPNDYVGQPTPSPTVLPTQQPKQVKVLGIELNKTPPAAVEAQAATLPVTGFDAAGLALLAVLAIGLGTVMVRRSSTKRRKSSA